MEVVVVVVVVVVESAAAAHRAFDMHAAQPFFHALCAFPTHGAFLRCQDPGRFVEPIACWEFSTSHCQRCAVPLRSVD